MAAVTVFAVNRNKNEKLLVGIYVEKSFII